MVYCRLKNNSHNRWGVLQFINSIWIYLWFCFESSLLLPMYLFWSLSKSVMLLQCHCDEAHSNDVKGCSTDNNNLICMHRKPRVLLWKMIPPKTNYSNQLTPICLLAQFDAACIGSPLSTGFTFAAGILFIALSGQLAQPERAFTASLLLHGCSLSVAKYRCVLVHKFT